MAMPREPLGMPVDAAEDDSPFLSMADFFSLISLTVIYVVIAFSPQSPLSRSAIDVVTGVASATGPASDIDNDVAYVALLAHPTGVLLRVVPAGNAPMQEQIIALSEPGEAKAVEWLRGLLSQTPNAGKVIFYLDASNEQAEVHKLLHRLMGDTKRDFAVSLVFLDEGQLAP